MRFTRHHRSFVAVLAALLLLLAACGNDDDDTAAVGAGNGDETNGEVDDNGADEEPDDTTTTTAEETTTTTEAEPDVGTGAECLIGTWQLDNDAWAAAFQQMVPPDAPMGDTAVSGRVQIEFRADGTSTSIYEDWTIHSEVTQPAPGEMTITRDGDDHGTYTAGDDGSISYTGTETNSTVDVTSVIGGQTMAMPGIEGDQTDVIGEAGSYTCEVDRLSIEVDGVTVWFDRVG